MSHNQVPDAVGVYGGGRMGAGIAHAFLVAGSSAVVVLESTDESAAAARSRVVASVNKAAERGVLDAPAEAILERLVISTNPRDLASSQMVVEAVPENVALKAKVLTAIEEHAPDAWVATNTSSLSVDGLAAALTRPERFVGLHFFNPVPASSLVEVVVGTATDEQLVERALGWIEGLGKTGITVRDTPGFASSRLGVAIALEAMRMVESGVASAVDIDTAMTLGYRHPMGPLRTTDVVGLDVRLAIAEHLASELGPRFEPPDILRTKVADGNLGRKTGHGFFEW
jgi:3-hydroxybutyryl-CoA dehydrogenase